MISCVAIAGTAIAVIAAMSISKCNERTTILFGADVEISHFLSTSSNNYTQAPDRLLLDEMPGVPADGASNWKRSICAYEYGRVFDARNGSSYYSELGHLETCVPLCASPKELVAYVEANRQRVRIAQWSINNRSDNGSHLMVLFESRCGRASAPVSIGAHYNYLIRRGTWDRICSGQHPAITGFVASVMAGFQLLAGQGCVGSANGRPAVDYQISQRSDFITKVCCLDTMVRGGRGLINTRDEPECGRAPNDNARFHHICLDFPVNQFALFATAGVVSLVLASVTLNQIDISLILEDPVNTFWSWSHDPELTAVARLANGSTITSAQYLSRTLEFLSRASVRDGLGIYVSNPDQILEYATQTSDAFLRRDWSFLARRVDWVLKRQILSQTIENVPGLNWSSPKIALLDQIYGSADSNDSLYISQRDCAGVVRIVSDAEIEEAMLQPPPETRSWGHTMLLRRLSNAAGYRILSVNWDRITVLRLEDGTELTTWFNDPYKSSKNDCAQFFQLESIHEILLSLGVVHGAHWKYPSLPTIRPAPVPLPISCEPLVNRWDCSQSLGKSHSQQ